MNIFRRLAKRIYRRINPIRQAVVCRRIQRNASVHVFRKDVDDLGSGPGASLYIDDKEVLRFDCFGQNGHYHEHLDEAVGGESPRIFFVEKTREEQIARTALELSGNLPAHLATSNDPLIRAFKPDSAALEAAASWAKAMMYEYAKRMGR